MSWSNSRAIGAVITRGTIAGSDFGLSDEVTFHRLIALERKRTERSGNKFALMLVSTGNSLPSSKGRNVLAAIARALSSATTDTDIIGWYKHSHILGVLFTEIGADENNAVLTTLLGGVICALRDKLTVEQFSEISISAHLYPETWEHELARRPSNPVLYPDLATRAASRRMLLRLKRLMDIVGSLLALILFAPLFIAIALAIKLTSKGPVFFKQERNGEYGKPFIFIKFRSMYVNNDVGVHRQWFTQFVSGQAEKYRTDGKSSGVFKMTIDPRVTNIGRMLRRTSLDELPQFINVLKGDMSLVGPRPPIPYEVDAYQTWHRGRILQAKPGITGLWQVNGRSRVTFDEMVRLDLTYARTWSLWQDIKILLRTPGAVLRGDGAY
jgi:exopolysaccharide biosynthesis polyprenyl glycosylphosphotransferase